MTKGSGRSRRPLTIRVAGTVGAGLGLMLGLAGCRGVARPGAVPNRPLAATLGTARTALAPATLAISLPPETASIDPKQLGVGTTTPSSLLDADVSPAGATTTTTTPKPPSPPEPTPLLDAALLKARQQGSVPDEPKPSPAIAPAEVTRPAPATPAEPSSAVVPASFEAASLPSVLPSSAIPPPPSPAPAAEPPAEAKPASPEEAWRDGIRRLVGLARARQDQAGAAGPGDPWGLRARVLAWLAEPDIDPDLGPREADGVRSVLHALAATASGPSGNAQLRGDEVRVAVRTLEAQAPLELVDLRLCQAVDGFGDFTPVDAARLRAGTQVVIYVEVDGVHHELTSRGYHSRLAGRREIAPEQGGPSVSLPLPPAEETLERRRRDYFVNYLLDLPRDLTPGAYTLRVTLTDGRSGQTASRAIPFRIVADDPPPAPPGEPAPAIGVAP